MNKINEEEKNKILGERLQSARVEAGFLKRAHAIREFGWTQSTYAAHETGARKITEQEADSYSAAFKVPIEYLLGFDLISDMDMEKLRKHVSTVPVYGAASAGVWRESEDLSGSNDNDEAISAVSGYTVKEQYARKIIGNSVSNRIQNGSYAIIVARDSFEGPIPYGKLVDVKRERSGIVEHTIKAYYGDKLMTDSAELANQEAIDLSHTDEDTTVTILGVVIAAMKHV